MYGRQPKTALDGYAPIPYERHAADYRRACQGKGPWFEEYLVEQHGEEVVLLPNDSTPYPWREIWRRI